ncbi:hypothetical protein SCUCBS95973_001515 [Sporothrix curviconia]|uniref:FAD/NAD(P)-binding domain-containing protein n=1 Tax=Sporothrix curviconia TaxID=1260050 RepID=A0ABP0AZC9_9PEZI
MHSMMQTTILPGNTTTTTTTATTPAAITASVLVIGAGPAGIAAAMTLARQQHSVLLFGDGIYRNGRAQHSEHASLLQGQSPLLPGVDAGGARAPSNFGPAARDNMLAQHGAYVSYREATVVRVQRLGGHNDSSAAFVAVDNHGTQYTGRTVILASGVEELLLPVDGYAACFGRVLFPCLQCAGYEQQPRGGRTRAGVLAVGAFAERRAAVAVHVARQAASLVTEQVTIYTNRDAVLATAIRGAIPRGVMQRTPAVAAAAATATAPATATITVESRAVNRFVFLGDHDHELAGGASAHDAFLVHAPATRPRGPFIEQLSLAATAEGDIWVQLPDYRTSVPGVFAAGDNCAARMKSVAHAMLSGNVAGMGAGMQVSEGVGVL